MKRLGRMNQNRVLFEIYNLKLLNLRLVTYNFKRGSAANPSINTAADPITAI